MKEIEIHDVTGFETVENYVLCVFFDDDTEQLIDFEPILYGPLFGALRDLNLFRQVELNNEIGTLVWPNGADIDPTVLYHWPEHVAAIIKRRKERYAVTS